MFNPSAIVYANQVFLMAEDTFPKGDKGNMNELGVRHFPTCTTLSK